MGSGATCPHNILSPKVSAENVIREPIMNMLTSNSLCDFPNVKKNKTKQKKAARETHCVSEADLALKYDSVPNNYVDMTVHVGACLPQRSLLVSSIHL